MAEKTKRMNGQKEPWQQTKQPIGTWRICYLKRRQCFLFRRLSAASGLTGPATGAYKHQWTIICEARRSKNTVIKSSRSPPMNMMTWKTNFLTIRTLMIEVARKTQKQTMQKFWKQHACFSTKGWWKKMSSLITIELELRYVVAYLRERTPYPFPSLPAPAWRDTVGAGANPPTSNYG